MIDLSITVTATTSSDGGNNSFGEEHRIEVACPGFKEALNSDGRTIEVSQAGVWLSGVFARLACQLRDDMYSPLSKNLKNRETNCVDYMDACSLGEAVEAMPGYDASIDPEFRVDWNPSVTVWLTGEEDLSEWVEIVRARLTEVLWVPAPIEVAS